MSVLTKLLHVFVVVNKCDDEAEEKWSFPLEEIFLQSKICRNNLSMLHVENKSISYEG